MKKTKPKPGFKELAEAIMTIPHFDNPNYVPAKKQSAGEEDESAIQREGIKRFGSIWNDVMLALSQEFDVQDPFTRMTVLRAALATLKTAAFSGILHQRPK